MADKQQQLPPSRLTKQVTGDPLDAADRARTEPQARDGAGGGGGGVGSAPDREVTISFRTRDSLRRELKMLAARHGEPLQDVYTRALEEYLGRNRR